LFSSSCFALREWVNEIVPRVLQTCTGLKIHIFCQKGAISLDDLIIILSGVSKSGKERFDFKNEIFAVYFFSCSKFKLLMKNAQK
jgi:hypothetical protein